ncbi:uncharacterized protein LOC123403418 [Hordeum vulgare subsp. vulgare]|uniref:uncharacterized protein LOC123403418 n=1 Tax=Hordeum vulgare subsp. vulgare TaxID=112509 RepID=UPI00162CB8A4|nr:uncharacterized protein LOC123403418 [Hordeum vulgare subsp. vulgare]
MSSWSTPPPEETRGRQQWLALRLRDLRCAWAAAWRAFTPVVAWVVRLSAEKDEGIPFASFVLTLNIVGERRTTKGRGGGLGERGQGLEGVGIAHQQRRRAPPPPQPAGAEAD